MTFKEKLKNYAALLVNHGLNVQPGQYVQISADAIHKDLALLAVEEAYKLGACYVHLDLVEPKLTRIRVKNSKAEDLDFVPDFLGVKYKEMITKQAATLSIRGAEEPDILEGLDPKAVNTIRMSRHKAIKEFYDDGIGKSKVHWTVANAATPGWGKKVFPELPDDKACKKLWDAIFKATRADQENCLELWKKHNDNLHERADRLNDLKISELHFTGPGTDLIVGLSDKAIFKGGGDVGPYGVEFEPNIPTEEVFTTPDYRVTKGKVRATRPFLINGVLIEDLELEFVDGVISNFKASSGEEMFKEYISSDEGAKRLGEVALVGCDSPIFQSGLVFQDILFDENAACHIAIGSAYKFCLAGGDSLSEEELKEIGCNESSVHTDMMISSVEVNVQAKTYSGDMVSIIKNGEWV